jgi:hypothetical protein
MWNLNNLLTTGQKRKGFSSPTSQILKRTMPHMRFTAIALMTTEISLTTSHPSFIAVTAFTTQTMTR